MIRSYLWPRIKQFWHSGRIDPPSPVRKSRFAEIKTFEELIQKVGIEEPEGPFVVPFKDDEKEQHECTWQFLSPRLPSGAWYSCRGCNGEKFEPSARCTCRNDNHGMHFTGNQWQPWAPNRTIDHGVCSVCRCIVPGYEEEADGASINW